MFSKNDYFEGSCGHFRIQPSSWARVAAAALEPVFDHGLDLYEFDNLELVGAHQNSIKLGNHVWEPNFVSISRRWGSMSAYWVSQDGRLLLRLSDHWSKAERGLTSCGAIRACRWYLDGRPQAPVLWTEHNLALGLIAFSDLRKI